MTLSEKIEENSDDTMEEFELSEDERKWIYEKDVKEFIKELKDALKNGLKHDGNKIYRNEWKIIDELAGGELVK